MVKKENIKGENMVLMNGSDYIELQSDEPLYSGSRWTKVLKTK